MGSLFGGLFSGIGSLVSGLFNEDAQAKSNEASMAQFYANENEQNYWNSINQQNTVWNQQFATQQAALAQQQQQFNNWVTQGGNIGSVMANIVDSAKANGISPLAALGMQTPGASVVPGVGAPGGGAGSFSPISADQRPVTGMGTALGSMGQDVGRAIEGYMDSNSREAALKQEYMRAQITNLDAQSASLTMESARRLGATGTAKPNKNVNDWLFGKEPQWPVGIPGDVSMGVLKGIDAGANWLNAHGWHEGSWVPDWFKNNSPDPNVYNTP